MMFCAVIAVIPRYSTVLSFTQVGKIRISPLLLVYMVSSCGLLHPSFTVSGFTLFPLVTNCLMFSLYHESPARSPWGPCSLQGSVMQPVAAFVKYVYILNIT